MSKESFMAWKIPRIFTTTNPKKKIAISEKDFADRCTDPNSHTEFENGTLVLAVKQDTSVSAISSYESGKTQTNLKPNQIAAELTRGFAHERGRDQFAIQGGNILRKAEHLERCHDEIIEGGRRGR
jgi:hypothetical protein